MAPRAADRHHQIRGVPELRTSLAALVNRRHLRATRLVRALGGVMGMLIDQEPALAMARRGQRVVREQSRVFG